MTARRPPLSIAPQTPDHEPDLAPEQKAAILAALRWAWAEVQREHPNTLGRGKEEAITERMQFFLNSRVSGERRARWLRDFEMVSRSENQRTSDGRIEKKPDLTFRPPVHHNVVDGSRWGWFVECKLVKDGASVSAYRDKGVRRFADGEYAAWMRSGAMLAYVRNKSLSVATLGKSLHGKVRTVRHVVGTAADTSESEHARGSLSPPCVDVTLTHLWLVV